jgi:uncharacterized membrane protein YkoI
VKKQNKQSGFSIIEIGIVVVVVAVLGFLGWKFYDAKVNQAQVNNAADKADAVDMVPAALSDLAEIKTIRDDAVTDKPGVTVIHIELEQSGDNLVYKAELSDGTVTVYNARTGARIKSMAVAEKTTEVLPANVTTGISFAKALEVARAEKPGSKVYKIELELEGGVVVYSVRFTDKARVDVNAQSGAIVRTKAAKVETTNTDKKATESTTTSGSSNSGKSATSHSGSSNSGSSNSGSGRSGGEDDGAHRSGDDDLSDNDDDDSDDSSDDHGDDSHGGSDDDSDDSSNSGSGSGRR